LALSPVPPTLTLTKRGRQKAPVIRAGRSDGHAEFTVECGLTSAIGWAVPELGCKRQEKAPPLPFLHPAITPDDVRNGRTQNP
jgi:hypothetical protein